MSMWITLSPARAHSAVQQLSMILMKLLMMVMLMAPATPLGFGASEPAALGSNSGSMRGPSNIRIAEGLTAAHTRAGHAHLPRASWASARVQRSGG